METKIQSLYIEIDESLRDFVELKLFTLDKIFDGIGRCNVNLYVEKGIEGKNKVAEIKISVPKKILIVKVKSETFKQSVGLAVKELEKQLLMYKGKLHPYI